MAQSTRLIRLQWENGVQFKMDTKLNDGEYITIIEMEENGCIGTLWDTGAGAICKKFFDSQIDDIGDVMRS